MPAVARSSRKTRKAALALAVAIASAIAAVLALTAGASAQDGAALPDPLERGSYEVERVDPFLAGLATLHEPQSAGGAATGSASEITLQVRGSLYKPADRSEPSPLIVLVHGNHANCDSGSSPNCTIFKRNDAGYAYIAENLASWGYIVVSLDQDQMMSRQDGPKGKGMHQRRLLIAALLDALYEANESGLPVGEDANLGDSLVDRIDFTRIGMMGHSRGGDAITSFLDYNRMRPEPGRRYPIRGAISLAPVDYERKAPYGTPYMTILPYCDGDVSNLHGARFYERSQYVMPGDPFPRIQSSQLGANHNWYNTVWIADGQDGGNVGDAACGNNPPNNVQPNNTRLSGGAFAGAYVIDNSDKGNPEVDTRVAGDPERMGDQPKIGLATMGAFFRRYVGGEGAFDPYMTGELSSEGEGRQIPDSACPTSESGVRMDCADRVMTSYFAPPAERLDVIRPEAENPLGVSALGTTLEGEGFSSPYRDAEGNAPDTGWEAPESTEGGYDWCNPEPLHFAPSQLGFPYSNTQVPLAAKPCPLPALSELGTQSSTRERAPVNYSYGRQLALAWEDPVAETGQPATLATRIPTANRDLSHFRALAMAADVNFFDDRNPDRGEEGLWNPAATTQDFTIALTDADGNEATVAAGDPSYGRALQQTVGSVTARVNIVLNQIRVPVSDFADQGVDLTAVRELELRFGEQGMPEAGSIQLADVRFQEPVDGTGVLIDSTERDAGPATGPPPTGPDPAEVLESFDRAPGSVKLPDVVVEPGSSTWTVDDDRVECPGAEFTSIQDAVDYAAPWDTLVVCDGVYEERSGAYHGVPLPNHHGSNPVEEGSANGLTITKPLKIKGAGADKVTIKPHPDLGPSLAGAEPYLRDGGGNVITISRQSLGSTDDNEHFVDISGVTVTSPDIYAEAGIGFLNASGRIADSVVGPLWRAPNAAQLAERPHGWGVVSTNSLLGVGPGTVERQVTIERSLVSGYQSGGILFDNSRGTDGHPDNLVDYGIKTSGYVKDTVVAGSGPDSLIGQTGIQFHAGVKGFVEGSRITGNAFPADQRRSVGILLTGAATDGDWHASGNAISGNGYGLYNAGIANDDVREGAPALATGNYWGAGAAPVEGESDLGAEIEGISGPDADGEASMIVDPVLGSEPGGVPSGAPAPVPDEPPLAAIVDPASGAQVTPGLPLAPVVVARDDFAVRSVSLTANGEPVGAQPRAPFAFDWTPSPADLSETVTLEATITDSAGQTTVETVEVEVAGPVLAVEVDPESHEIGPNRKQVQYRVAATNVGNLASGPVSLCIEGAPDRVEVKDDACTEVPEIPAAQARQRVLQLRVLPAAVGELTEITISATGPAFADQSTTATLRVGGP